MAGRPIVVGESTDAVLSLVAQVVNMGYQIG